MLRASVPRDAVKLLQLLREQMEGTLERVRRDDSFGNFDDLRSCCTALYAAELHCADLAALWADQESGRINI